MPKFRKRPVEVEAIQWDGTEEGFEVVAQWLHEEDQVFLHRHGHWYISPEPFIEIIHNGKFLTVSSQQWIAREEENDLFVFHPDIFEQTYEPIEESGSSVLSVPILPTNPESDRIVDELFARAPKPLKESD